MKKKALSDYIIKSSVGRNRYIVAIAGPPGAGKTTLAQALQLSLKEKSIQAKIISMDEVGCEKFAELTHNFSSNFIEEQTNQRVKLISVEVFEHGANSAVFKSI